jgi:hypothetical protein
VRLLAIPGAAARRAKAAHDVDKGLELFANFLTHRQPAESALEILECGIRDVLFAAMLAFEIRMADNEHTEQQEQDSDQISFAAFVLSLAHTAAVHFGDIPDPVSGQRAEANLPAAQQMIDILSLLEAKTRGNLTAEERQLLDQILYELRLRYVEATKPQSRIITP